MAPPFLAALRPEPALLAGVFRAVDLEVDAAQTTASWPSSLLELPPTLDEALAWKATRIGEVSRATVAFEPRQGHAPR